MPPLGNHTLSWFTGVSFASLKFGFTLSSGDRLWREKLHEQPGHVLRVQRKHQQVKPT